MDDLKSPIGNVQESSVCIGRNVTLAEVNCPKHANEDVFTSSIGTETVTPTNYENYRQAFATAATDKIQEQIDCMESSDPIDLSYDSNRNIPDLEQLLPKGQHTTFADLIRVHDELHKIEMQKHAKDKPPKRSKTDDNTSHRKDHLQEAFQTCKRTELNSSLKSFNLDNNVTMFISDSNDKSLYSCDNEYAIETPVDLYRYDNNILLYQEPREESQQNIQDDQYYLSSKSAKTNYHSSALPGDSVHLSNTILSSSNTINNKECIKSVCGGRNDGNQLGTALISTQVILILLIIYYFYESIANIQLFYPLLN